MTSATLRTTAEGAAFGLRLSLGCVLAYSGLAKIRYPFQFLDSVFEYEILPPVLGIVVAVCLPWIEVVVGATLVSGVLRRGAMLSGIALSALFCAAQVHAIRNELSIDCGCFGSSAGQPHFIDYGTLARAVLMLVGALVGYVCTIVAERSRIGIVSAKQDEKISISSALAVPASVGA